MKFLKLGIYLILLGLAIVVGGTYLIPMVFAPRQNVTVNVADKALQEQGEKVAQLSDCVACHTGPSGRSFAGGLAMKTPVGTVYSTNITPDKETGIGQYDYADFERAVRHGMRKDGAPLYPAMPYVSYSLLTDDDVKALYAYFVSSVKPVVQANQAPAFQWPYNIRWSLTWWQVVFGSHGGFVPPPGATPEIARGAYLVQGAAHCGTCHTPRGSALQEKALRDEAGGLYLSGGGEVEGWFAKGLRQETMGLAGWSKQDIQTFLKTGRNDHTAAFGSMAEVVEHGTQHLTDADASAMAAYLITLAPRPGHSSNLEHSEDATTAKLYSNADDSPGARAYVAYCASCHRMNGQGTARLFPALAGNSMVRSEKPGSLIRITLTGGAMVKTPADATRPSMPELAKLDDHTVADILTFIRSHWGNRASPVSEAEVASVRHDVLKQLSEGAVQNVMATPGSQKNINAGRELALDRAKGNCLACHTLKGGDAPSTVGRELAGMRARFPQREDLVEILTNEPMRNSIAPMPAFGKNHVLTPQEIGQIVDFLYTL
jgi:sulfur oxidation c-type cytochrome SoxX